MFEIHIYTKFTFRKKKMLFNLYHTFTFKPPLRIIFLDFSSTIIKGGKSGGKKKLADFL